MIGEIPALSNVCIVVNSPNHGVNDNHYFVLPKEEVGNFLKPSQFAVKPICMLYCYHLPEFVLVI